MRAALLLPGLLAWSAAAPAFGQACEAPDAFEDNDLCASAAVLAPGSYTALSVQGPSATLGVDEDHYRLTLAAGEQVAVDAFFSTAAGDIDLELYGDAACSVLVDASYSLSDDEQVAHVNATGAPLDLTLVVRGFGADFDCNLYDLLVVTSPDPCAALVPDAAEDDDDCGSAATLYGGTTPARNVALGDPDWFHITLDPGEEFTFELHFLHAQGDLDLRLWDQCPGGGADPIARSETEADDEWAAYSNSSPATVELWVEVYVWPGSASACNDYEVVATFEGGAAATLVCPGDGTFGPGCPCGNFGAADEGCANSSGSGARLTATGTDGHAADDLVLHVDGGRDNQPGMALQGGSLAGIPFRDGLLCTGAPSERLEVLALDANGSAATSVSIVQAGNVPGPGATTFYQVWYRDPVISPCGTGSNFSNALRVDWN